MVYFTCNHCGASLKKSTVEKHYQGQCRRSKFLTCVDCMKDFCGEDFVAHTRCITEAEKYSAKGTTSQHQGPHKGEAKQQSWMEAVRRVCESTAGIPREQRTFLDKLLEHENVPQKRAKFLNFAGCIGFKANRAVIESVWDLLEREKNALKKNQANGDAGKLEKNEGDNNKTEILAKTNGKAKNDKHHTDSKKAMENNGISSDVPNEEEESGERKQKKRKRKKAEVGESLIETSQKCVGDEIPSEENASAKKAMKNGNVSSDVANNEEDCGEKKQKRKRRKAEVVESVEEAPQETAEAEDFSEKHNKAKKKKKKKGTRGEEVDSTTAEPAEKKMKTKENGESIPAGTENGVKEKFHWSSEIKKALVTANGGELPVKHLQKEVLSQFSASGGEIDEKVKQKFMKKLSNNAAIMLRKDKAKLISD